MNLPEWAKKWSIECGLCKRVVSEKTEWVWRRTNKKLIPVGRCKWCASSEYHKSLLAKIKKDQARYDKKRKKDRENTIEFRNRPGWKKYHREATRKYRAKKKLHVQAPEAEAGTEEAT